MKKVSSRRITLTYTLFTISVAWLSLILSSTATDVGDDNPLANSNNSVHNQTTFFASPARDIFHLDSNNPFNSYDNNRPDPAYDGVQPTLSDNSYGYSYRTGLKNQQTIENFSKLKTLSKNTNANNSDDDSPAQSPRDETKEYGIFDMDMDPDS